MLTLKRRVGVIGLVLVATSGCRIADERIPQVNACVARPSFDGLICPGGPDAGRAVALKRMLTICDGQLHSGGNLPIESYQFCQNQLVESFSTLEGAACKDLFVDATRCVLKTNLVKEISVLVHPEPNPVEGQPVEITGRIHSQDLQKLLSNFGTWYRQTVQPIYQSEALERVKLKGVVPELTAAAEHHGQLLLQELADQDQREIVDAFWAAIVNSSKSDELLQRQLDFYTQNEASLQVAEGVILQGEYPAPLFMRLLGNSLKVLADRVHYLASIADLGCSIDSCRGNTNTELFRVISLLGSLGDKQEFQRLEPGISQINHRLARFFTHVARNAAPIERNLIQFIESYGGDLREYHRTHDLLKLKLSNVPLFARGLLGIIHSNRILRNSYQTSGFYSWTRGDVTEFGFSSNLDSIVQIATHAQQDFGRKWAEFQIHRRDHGQRILEERTWQNSVARLRDESQRQMERIAEIGEDLNGLRASLSSVRERTSHYLANVFSVLNSSSYFERYGSRYVVDRVLPPFIISPQAAPENPKSTLIGDIVVQSVAPIPLSKGQIASVQLERNWSPTCALRRMGFRPESVAGALIGPEGFMMGMSQGHARVHSVVNYQREDKTTRVGSSTSICHRASLGVIGELLGQQASMTNCTEFSYGQSNSGGRNTDDLDSTETRQTAAFNLGIRSPWAPFEHFPAGSLLIAQVRRAGQFRYADILSIEVAQRSNQILAQDDVDLYFIVNDCNDPENKAAQGLQVSAEIRTQEGAIARQVSVSMVDAVRHVDGQIDSILMQGDISPQQMNTLRDEMFMKLAADPRGRSRQALGPVLSEFFQFWVENELLEVEKRSRIRRLERNLRTELSNLKRIESDIERTMQLEKIYELQKLWTLDSLDIIQFTQDLKSAIDRLNRYIIPVIAFQAPERIAALRGRDSVRFLRDGLTLESSVDDIARAIGNLYTDVAESEGLHRLVFNGWRTTDVVLSFPRPDLADRIRANPLTDDPLSLWKKGPRTMAERLWNSLQSEAVRATLTVTPEDLYDAAQRTPDTLDCTKMSPVIQAMGLYFVTPDNAGEGPGAEYEFNLGFQARGPMAFPGETRLQSFTLVGESLETWLRQTVPYTVGPRQQARLVLSRANIDPLTRTGSGAGLSPFMDFNFDFSKSAFGPEGSLSAYTPSIREILLVLRLNYRPSTIESMNWMPACAALTH